MKLGLHQSARLEQRLVQSPQMIQAMKILQLPALDLEARIQQELDENLMLEVQEPDGSSDEGDEPSAPLEDSPKDSDRDAVEKMLEDLERLDRDFGDGGRQPIGDGEEGDRKQAALQNAPDVPKSMAAALSEELAFLDLTPRERTIADFLIFSLDERGYLTDSLEELAQQCPIEPGTTAPVIELDEEEEEEDEGETPRAAEDGAALEERGRGAAAGPVAPEAEPAEDGTDGALPAGAHPDGAAPDGADPEPARAGLAEHGATNGTAPADPSLPEGAVTPTEIAFMLVKLRTLVHPGLGARDLRETLLLQLEAAGLSGSLESTIVANHLEDLQQNRLPRIAKVTGQSLEAIKDAIEVLRKLDPTPGTDYGETTAEVIVPEVIVEEIDGEYVVRLDRQRVPQLTLSGTYRRMLKQAQKGDNVEAWLKKRLDAARWFIDAVNQRQSTLERIAVVIFARQRPFLDKGMSALQPLRMQEVADEVGVHISTVSRAVSGKYAQTPRGIFPLKFFFSGGTKKAGGEMASQIGVQQRIKALVEKEDPEHPFSDEELARELEERENIRIARRTVTKYRKMLGIPSSSQRKQF